MHYCRYSVLPLLLTYITTLYTTTAAAVAAATAGDAGSVCSEAYAGSSALHAALVQRNPEAVRSRAAP
jgi:hypothetical protein